MVCLHGVHVRCPCYTPCCLQRRSLNSANHRPGKGCQLYAFLYVLQSKLFPYKAYAFKFLVTEEIMPEEEEEEEKRKNNVPGEVSF